MMEIKLIGNKIAEARMKVNSAQAKLAEHLFISAQAVVEWELEINQSQIQNSNILILSEFFSKCLAEKHILPRRKFGENHIY